MGGDAGERAGGASDDPGEWTVPRSTLEGPAIAPRWHDGVGGRTGFRDRVRRIGNRFARRSLVLIYHRVDPSPSDLAVSPRNFGEQLEVLRREFHPVGLDRVLPRDGGETGPRRSVAVTLDDGYADSLTRAKPLLERFDVPATVFVTTGNLGDERGFWWDELARLLSGPSELPKTPPPGLEAESASGGVPLFDTLRRRLQSLSEEDRWDALDALARWSGADRGPRGAHRSLSAGELSSLVEGGLVSAGAHTVTHPVLSALAPQRQREEILESRARLEEITAGPVTRFAYPFGERGDYTEETVGILRDAGFDCACAAFRGVVRAGTDPFQLPRCAAGDWDGEKFRRRLRKWFLQ
jgi:peptidoglycan/xylan/chitin deacetylase (PgdA/CDA1 family)